MKQKLIILSLFLIIVNYDVNAQNLVKNPSFEILTHSLSSYTSIPEPFSTNKVQNWLSFVNSAEIYDASRNAIFDGNAAAFFWSTQTNGTPNYNEGIFQNDLNFKKNKLYIISVRYWIKQDFSDNVSLKLIAANNLQNTSFSLGNTNNSITNFENIGMTSDNRKGQWLEFKSIYHPSDDYSQLALVSTLHHLQSGATDSRLIIDNVIITESCCFPDITFNNTFNPPSINVQDFIQFNSNVTFNNNSSTYFTAKNEILLANNTTIDGVSAFIAQAEDCLNKRVELYQNIFEVHESKKCSFRVFLSACYGSSQYAFYFGEELSGDKYKDYPLGNAGNTITVKVVDLVTGEVITKSIQLPNKPHFTDSISVTIPNVFTPNGDGKNDYFRITDSNKTSYAYNATWFRFIVYNRWGNNILVQEGSLTGDDLNGFSDDVIYWNGRKENDPNQEELNAGTYYYILDIGNCLHTFSTRGSITLIRSSFREETSIDDEINSNANFPSEIYPNPTADNISLKLFNVNKNSQITITDILGKQLNIDCKLVENKNGIQEYNIDCSLLNNGIYFCNINKNGITETIKFSVIK